MDKGHSTTHDIEIFPENKMTFYVDLTIFYIVRNIKSLYDIIALIGEVQYMQTFHI